MRQKIDYLNIILKVYGFAGIFDFETVVEKDEKMETRMRESRLLEGVEYEKLMMCFVKRQRMKIKNRFCLNDYIMISDMILNDFGVGIFNRRSKKTQKNNILYVRSYFLKEVRRGVSIIYK